MSDDPTPDETLDLAPRKRSGNPVRNARIDDDRWNRINTGATRLGVTASDIIRDAIDEHLETLAFRIGPTLTPIAPVLQRDIDRNIGALELAEQQLDYWQDRVDTLRDQLATKEAIAER